MIASAEAELKRRVVELLGRERLFAAGAIRSYSTPRRLAIFVSGVELTQNSLMVETLGPSTKVAYRDGQPTPAAISFAKKAGVKVEDLRPVQTSKGEYLQAISWTQAREAVDVIAAELPKETGVTWSVDPRQEFELEAAPDWSRGEWRFQAPADAARLVLAYRRALGTTRREGTIFLRQVELKGETL